MFSATTKIVRETNLAKIVRETKPWHHDAFQPSNHLGKSEIEVLAQFLVLTLLKEKLDL